MEPQLDDRGVLRLAYAQYDRELLTRPCRLVERVTPAVKRLASQMLNALNVYRGAGLAANQVFSDLRMFVYDDGRGARGVLINPVIEEREGSVLSQEGCLSEPGRQYQVERATRVRVRGLDRSGKRVRINAHGYLAIIFQHEIDHLDGKLLSQHGTVAETPEA